MLQKMVLFMLVLCVLSGCADKKEKSALYITDMVNVSGATLTNDEWQDLSHCEDDYSKVKEILIGKVTFKCKVTEFALNELQNEISVSSSATESLKNNKKLMMEHITNLNTYQKQLAALDKWNKNEANQRIDR